MTSYDPLVGFFLSQGRPVKVKPLATDLHPRSLTARPWKMMLGRLLSFWDG